LKQSPLTPRYNIMSKCGPLDDLIVRDRVVKDIRSKILDVTNCILEQGCKFWQDDDKSAEEIAGCLVHHLDISEWTEDEFEYAVRVVNFFCALKLAHINGLLKKDEDGTINIPHDWEDELEGNEDDSQRHCGQR